MAVYRNIHVSFWQDGWVLDLTPEEKYFYLYLMTNSRTKQCGCYELPKRVVELETGYNRETVDKLIGRFVGYGKIKFSEQTQEVLLINWHRYNGSASPKVKACVVKEVKEIKSIEFKKYCIDSLSIEWGEEEQEKEQEKEETPPQCKFGIAENVALSDQELGKLIDKMGHATAYKYIDKVSTWEKVDKVKSCYLTVLKWWTKDGKPKEKGLKTL